MRVSKRRTSNPGIYLRNLMLAALIAALLGVLVLLVALINMEFQAFTGAKPSVPDVNPTDIGLDFEDVSLTTEDGLRISGWYVSSREPNRGVLVLVHGQGANRSSMLPTAEILARHGYDSLLIDLRAHGLSEGDMVTYGYEEVYDVVAAFEYLLSRGDVHPDRIGALGRSMGGAAVIRGAARSDIPKFIVIESTFSSLSDLIEDTYEAVSIFPKWPFANIITALAEMKVRGSVDELDLVGDLAIASSLPVFLIHGAEDEVIPIEHHLRLADSIKSGGEFWIIPGMGHASPAEYAPEEYERRLIRFLDNTEVKFTGIESSIMVPAASLQSSLDVR